MNIKAVLLIAFLVLGVPLLLCVLFKILPIGSIGPMVPITGIINAVALPFLIYFSMFKLINSRGAQIAVVVASMLGGVFLAILEMNALIGLSTLFGIMDYQLM